ncbi:MAG: hypothetical protein Q8O88_01465 [bacterium]|nr:hypothetical protein [bacterium]
MPKNDRTQDLAIQKLQVQLKDHIKNDDYILQSISETLKSIDHKLENFTSSIATLQTKGAITQADLTNHLKTHDHSKWQVGIVLSIVNVGIVISIFVLQNILFK